jgi:hypothetical protein
LDTEDMIHDESKRFFARTLCNEQLVVLEKDGSLSKMFVVSLVLSFNQVLALYIPT